MTSMIRAPMSAGSAPSMAFRPGPEIYQLFPFSSLLLFASVNSNAGGDRSPRPRLCCPGLRPGAAGLGAPEAAEGPADKRHEQREDAGDRQDGAQPLLGDLLLRALGQLRQRDAGELVDKARAHDGADDRQQDYHDQREHRNQDAVLEAGAAREPAGDVTADQEGQEQGDEEPYEARRAPFGAALHAHGAKDAADDRADDAAQDQAGAEGREPAEDDARPARA